MEWRTLLKGLVVTVQCGKRERREQEGMEVGLARRKAVLHN